MLRVSLQPAYVLHQRPYKNTSLLLEIFSADHGRIGLVANGARKGAWAALLQPFRPLQLSWSLRDDLGRLTHAEPDGQPPPLSGRALVCGFYLNELLIRLCHRHDPHPQIFAAYEAALTALGQEPLEAGLRRFEVALLASLGYGLQLEASADDGVPIHSDRTYHYRPEVGPLSVGDGEHGVAVSGASLLALAADDLNDARVLRELRVLLRACLRPLLGDKPLRSRDLFSAMMRRGPKHGEHE